MKNKKLLIIVLSIIFIIIWLGFYNKYNVRFNICLPFDFECRYSVLINTPLDKEFDSDNINNEEKVKMILLKYNDMSEFLFNKAENIYEIKYYSLEFVLKALNSEKYNNLLKSNKIKSFDEIYN